jgi:peptide/nickel transport system substrate-binding protein
MLALAVSCGRGAREAGARSDPHPLPQDTMTVAVGTPGTHGGRFVLAVTSPPKTFNPLVGGETSTTDVTNRLYASLTNFDNESQIDVPELARSWELSPDGAACTYRLRRGAAFSDGHPITSADVRFSFELAYDDSIHASVGDLLKMNGRRFELSFPDSYTVVVRAPAPNALLVALVSAVRILPRHVLEPAYRSGRFPSAYGVNTPPESLVTSGPWRLAGYAANERVVLSRNPYWFQVDARGQRLPYLDELVFLVVPDQDAADLKFRAGEVDAVDNVKPENYRWYEEHQREGGFTLHDLGPGLNSNFLWFNLNRLRQPRGGRPAGAPAADPVRHAWFREPAFRRAVSLAINRDAMIRSVFFGDAVKNWSTATPGNLRWYTPDVVKYDYDPERARALLAGLGWRDRDGDGVLEDARGHSVSFTIQTNGDSRLRVAMANFVRDDLARVGIRATLAPIEFNTLMTHLRDDFQYDCILLGIQTGVPPDPGMSQNTWRSSGRGHFWHILQNSPETPEEARIDSLMDGILSTTDPAERRRIWTEIQNIVNEQCWFVWLPALKLKVPVRDGFGNLRPSVIPHRLLWNIERVYAKPRPGRA